MSVLAWGGESTRPWERPARLRLLPGLGQEPLPGLGQEPPPATSRAVKAAAGALARPETVRLAGAGFGVGAGEAAWELTRRGLALALGGVAAILGGSLAATVWGFAQLVATPLP
ncbi:MAG: hypothetical protein LBI84_03365 [Propionibacteriaceae bacterium]|jgi:hypothetical protein|nr:hypothetical protein [Propionibacteriaceae bacterium]